MTVLTGVVAVLNPAKDTVVQVLDLGPNGADTKPGRVLPLIESQPVLSAGQSYGTPTFTIGANSVTRNWPVAGPSTDWTRKNNLLNAADVVALMAQLSTATPAQIDTYMTNNVTSLAQARTVLATMAKMLAVIINQINNN